MWWTAARFGAGTIITAMLPRRVDEASGKADGTVDAVRLAILPDPGDTLHIRRSAALLIVAVLSTDVIDAERVRTLRNGQPDITAGVEAWSSRETSLSGSEPVVRHGSSSSFSVLPEDRGRQVIARR
jgi:hypothetical protein